MLLYRRSDAKKVPGETKNDPNVMENSPVGEPVNHPSIPRMIQHNHSSINGRQVHCHGVTWIARMFCGRPKQRCLRNWISQPEIINTRWSALQKKRKRSNNTKSKYKHEPTKIVRELQDQRHAAEASRAQVDARAGRKEPQAKKSRAPPV